VSKKLLKNIIGWSLSLSLHIAVVVAAYVGLPYLTRPEITPPPPIAIEFIAIAAETRQAAPKETVEEEAAEEKPQPKYAAAEQAADDPDDVLALPAKTEPKKAAPKPKPKPKPKLSKARKLAQSVRPRGKPKPPSRFKSTRIAALIDKSIKEEKVTVKKDEKKREDKKKSDPKKKKPTLFAGLQGRIATASIRDALSQKLAGCWSFPSGAKGVEAMQVRVLIHLRPDGSLLRQPEVVGAGKNAEGFYRVFVESARRAVIGCAPYSDVARTLFDMGESSIDFNFNGAEFAGG
jgi:outer membrane biosynthesis protein TonB